MALRPQASFSTGELDEALHERTTLQKYDSALATGRGAMVGKTGRLISMFGRKHLVKTKLSDSRVKVYSPPGSGYFLEFGDEYVRVYLINGGNRLWHVEEQHVDGYLLKELDSEITEDDLPNLHFDYSENTVYIFGAGEVKAIYLLTFEFTDFIDISAIFYVQDPPSAATPTASGTPTGYDVQWAITRVVDGEESEPIYITASGNKLPIAAGQKQRLTVTCPGQDNTEIRVYRRPYQAGSYGYIGSSSFSTVPVADQQFLFDDLGGEPDYLHAPPELEEDPSDSDIIPKTGAIFEQRLLLGNIPFLGQDAILSSRTSFFHNFTRDFPLSDDSALLFKPGASGSPRVRRMIVNEGLVVFTTAGVYRHAGGLAPANLGLDHKGNWLIADLEPLNVPGGVIFLDAKTNTVRILQLTDAGTYRAPEISTYSDHLFVGKTITSWCFHDGETPCLIATFSDGSYATLTYEEDQEMRAWMRHDTQRMNTEQVVSTGIAEKTLFVTEINGERYIEVTLPRFVSADLIADNPEAVMNESIAYMDSIVSYSDCLNDSLRGTLTISVASVGTAATGTLANHGFTTGQILDLYGSTTDSPYNGQFAITVTGTDTFTFTLLSDPATDYADVSLDVFDEISIQPVEEDNWEGDLLINCESSALFPADGAGEVGAVLRWFNPEDGTSINFTVTARTDDNNITVTADELFDGETYATENPRLYLCASTIDGLDHMEGESVAIVVDGYVVASPNNDHDADGYPTVTVVDGEITLPSSVGNSTGQGAIIHVGRPKVGDIETLDIDTVEQRPVLIESKTSNKVYIKVHKSRGLFAGNRFPEGDVVQGEDPNYAMQPIEILDTNENYIPDDSEADAIDLIGNRYIEPVTKRYGVALPGDWNSNGRICIRAVDPLHWQILSITPDLEDLRRMER